MAGKGGYRPGAGRPRGAKSKLTVERELERKFARGRPRGRLNDRTIAAMGGAEARAETAARSMDAAITSRRKLAKEVLEEFMFVFAGMAAQYQPAPPGMPARSGADEEKFARWADKAVFAATQLAKYQSPQYRSIQLPAPAPEAGEKKRRFTLTVFEDGRPVPPMLTVKNGETVDDDA